MATSIARYLMNEAATGTTPTHLLDDQGTNDLLIDYSSGDAEYTSIASGRGMDFTGAVDTADVAKADFAIAADSEIGTALDEVTGASFRLLAGPLTSNSNTSRLIAIGASAGDTDFSICSGNSGQILVRWGQEGSDGGTQLAYPVLGASAGSRVVVDVVVDTTLATAADRIKVYYDGVLKSSEGGTVDQNISLSTVNNGSKYISIGNRPSGNRGPQTQIYYAELLTGQLTPTEISDGVTALLADNDANWVGEPDTTAPIISSPTGVQTGDTTASGTVSTDEGNGTLYYYTSTNSSETAATIKASGSSQAVSAAGTQNVTVTGLTDSTAYYLHYAQDDGATNESNVVSSTQFTTTSPQAAITNIDTDNDVQAAQTSVAITGVLFDLPISSVTLGGEVLTVTGSPTTTNITVDIPLHIDLDWDSTDNQLQVIDATATLNLSNVTLSAPTGWTSIALASLPNVDDTDSYFEYVQTDIGFVPAIGDTLRFEDAVGLTVDDQWLPAIAPPNTIAGAYKIWDDSLSTHTALSSYTWTDGDAVGSIELPASVNVTATASGLLSGQVRFTTLTADNITFAEVFAILSTSASLAATSSVEATTSSALLQEVTNFSSWLDTLPSNSATQKMQDFLQTEGMVGGITNMMYEYLKTKSSKNSNSERFQEWKDNGFN